MAAGALRHRDHRFEWDRAEFAAWASRAGAAYGYGVRLAGVGPESPAAGSPTQLAVFTKAEFTTAGPAALGGAVSERRGAAASGLRSDDRGTREERRGKTSHAGAPERAGNTA
jgi:hypothetical protein